MLLRLATLASGRTGVRPVVVETLAALLNAGITPVVREHGSLGCSGDLAPLAHCALVLMGEGEATGPDGVAAPRAGRCSRRPASRRVQLEAKEGLALVNGTDGMLGMLVLACADLRTLLATADVTAAMSVEALLGTDQVFLPELHLPLRPHPGQAASADGMLRLLAGSPLVASHRDGDLRGPGRLLAALRPAGHRRGARHPGHAELVAGAGAAGGRRQPGGAAGRPGRCPTATSTAPRCRTCSTSWPSSAPTCVDRPSAAPTGCSTRTARTGLPAFLADDPGVDSGLMIAQYTAAGIVVGGQAAGRARPASTRSRARRCRRTTCRWAGTPASSCAARSTAWPQVLAVELLAAARGLDLRAPLQPAAGTGAVRDLLRAVVAGSRPGPLPRPGDRRGHRAGAQRAGPRDRRPPWSGRSAERAQPSGNAHPERRMRTPLYAEKGRAPCTRERPPSLSEERPAGRARLLPSCPLLCTARRPRP